ncbi:hypothetical protein AAVH_35549 [Aphelenchoides avenae]|nr:hypothetical protein AAVH_35549 [Aphelenchus avenae]
MAKVVVLHRAAVEEKAAAVEEVPEEVAVEVKAAAAAEEVEEVCLREAEAAEEVPATDVASNIVGSVLGGTAQIIKASGDAASKLPPPKKGSPKKGPSKKPGGPPPKGPGGAGGGLPPPGQPVPKPAQQGDPSGGGEGPNTGMTMCPMGQRAVCVCAGAGGGLY